MKIVLSLMLFGLIFISSLFYLFQQDEAILEGPDKLSVATKKVIDGNLALTTTKKDLNTITSKPLRNLTFDLLLEELAPHEQEKYLILNKQLFNALDFSDKKSYESWLSEGFPSLSDINFVEQHDRNGLALLLINNMDSYPIFKESPDLNFHALSAVNFVESIKELEETIRYYIPSYQQGMRFPSDNMWPNNKRPEQIEEMLREIVTSYAATRKNTAIELLAKARFEQFSFGMGDGETNIDNVLLYLAKADKKLGGSNSLSNYVAEHYPENIQEYNSFKELLRQQ